MGADVPRETDPQMRAQSPRVARSLMRAYFGSDAADDAERARRRRQRRTELTERAAIVLVLATMAGMLAIVLAGVVAVWQWVL